ncbi:hypothetical protein ECMP02101712_1554, partial [Escherichia coli MP021017.12]
MGVAVNQEIPVRCAVSMWLNRTQTWHLNTCF